MTNLVRRILRRMERQRKIGWVDYSSDSFDYRIASARATRIELRKKGVRITLSQAMTA